MKRSFAALLTSIATLFVIVSAVIPHHHHGELTCMTVISCDNNNSHDKTTKTNNKNIDPNCIAKANYIISANNNEVKSKPCSCDNPSHSHLFPLVYLLSDYLIYNLQLSETEIEYGELTISYLSINASFVNGLRAPPYFV